MRLKQHSKKLASILLETSKDAVGEVNTSLQLVDSLLKKDARFKSLLLSKRISNEQKVEIFRSALADVCHPIVIEFLGIIAKKKSAQLIHQVAQTFNRIYKEKEGIVSVTAHLATTVEPDEKDAFHGDLENLLSKKVDLDIQLDEQLLGGIKLRIENTFLDGSLQNSLNHLRKELL